MDSTPQDVETWTSSLSEVLALAGLAPGDTRIVGGDPVLPTPFRIAAAGGAAIAAAAIAAAAFWRLRGGRDQSIRIDSRHAVAALRSTRYLRIDGAPPAETWDPLSGFHPVRDNGWISIHCNFPVHRDAALRVLGASAERSAMSAASRGWNGLELEDAIHAAGGCAGLVRTAAEWRAHPQAAAVADQPLLEITRIGEAAPRAFPAAPRPLDGIRVLDLTRVLAGPTCAKALAEHGADVLKVNSPNLAHSGAVELDTGIGKRAAHLDLLDPADHDMLRRLVETCDVFSQSYRPGTLAARGFGPEALAALRPGIVCVTLTAWGPTGPWRDRRGFDSIVQAVSGLAHESGDGATPKLMPVSAIDYVSGYLMAFGAMVALRRRAAEGGSWHVRVGLARVGKWIFDHGRVPAAELFAVPPELSDDEIARFRQETPSSAGLIGHLAPVAEMSATPPRWTHPPAMPGSHTAEWLPR